ncbi:hypothetical protein PMAYCL1PPCAC_03911, partial [Pristionchus mayeri]
IQVLVTIPVVIAMQYESLKIACSALVAIQEAFSLMLLLACKRLSERYYNTKFAGVNLNSRFEVRGIIELTRAILPICALALAVKALFFGLTYFAEYGDENYANDTHFLLRLVCIGYGYV